MKGRYVSSAMITAICLLPLGCLSRYGVGVTSYLSEDVPFPPVSIDTKIAVVTGSDPKEPLLEKEVKRKVEYLVAKHGFGMGSVENADYILTAFFAIDNGQTETGTRSVYHSGGVSQTRVYTSSGQWATATTHHPGYTTHEPYSYTYFTRYLAMNVYERERWVKANEKELDEAIAWRGTAVSSGSSSDLRSIIDYLLIATFDQFGLDTGERKSTTLGENDKRVTKLRESYRQESPR